MKTIFCISFLFLCACISCNTNQSEKKTPNETLNKQVTGNESTPTENNILNDQLTKLLSGNRRFLTETSDTIHEDLKRVKATQNEQNPFAVILTCSDSRMDTHLIFDQGIGDLFEIKNAGNLIYDIDMGSIEYAIEHLGIKLVVVVGHTNCGAIKAYVQDTGKQFKKHTNHIDDILEIIDHETEIKNIDKDSPDYYNACIKANILHSKNVIEKNKIVKENHARVIPLLYDLSTGAVSLLN
ncbi:carbonic anhydrase [Flavobacterium sp.]|uniref:carbonic anhydrase n=1 Tax=Flavobacterium sp. TaxID=239 RepID=UPI0025BA19E2|nr:carbonic anhydrase [Flavobacterium sp.]MBA4153779.1 carbonic anhydrase [Flavobacterium sp.]